MGVPCGRGVVEELVDVVLFMCYNGTMSTEKEVRINMRYPREVYEMIKRFAQEDSRSFHSMVIWILREYIKQRQGK
jgi:hypothetical protein